MRRCGQTRGALWPRTLRLWGTRTRQEREVSPDSLYIPQDGNMIRGAA